MKKIRVILIDDERLAREELRRMLDAYPDFEIIAEAGNADDAVQLIEMHQPDLVLLDIQMPGKSGFDLLEMLPKVPEVIFVTAYDQYAVKAFETDALDYIVKPVRTERFSKIIGKVRNRLSKTRPQQKQIFVKDGNKCHFIRMDEICLIESMENYARLYFRGTITYLKRSLNQLETELDQAMFFRINRSQIINANFINHIEQAENGRLNITLHDGKLLEVSDRQSVKFKANNRLKSS
ncbi:MAG: response regulator transcription factor [Bacteroidetes bacterium]|jgi:two-component system LytT family response regulator|nr:response regulator transcription factor [Bacteroidota bacterium]